MGQRLEGLGAGNEALLAAEEHAELAFQRVLGAGALQLDAAQQQRERQTVGVQHAASHALVHRLSQDSASSLVFVHISSCMFIQKKN